jgi:putative chitinase
MAQTKPDWRRVQTRLGPLYPATIDGDPGAKTWSGLVGFAAPAASADAVTLRGQKLAEVAEHYGLTTAERIAGFLSNAAHETSEFTRLRENLNYTSAAQIRRTWPSRFATDAAAAAYVRNPIALANKVYARTGEGNVNPGDGWRYRGGGDFQITFRNGYVATGEGLGLPLEDHPELIETPGVAVLAGLLWFSIHGLAAFYDAGQPLQARSVINTGGPGNPSPIGWPDVKLRHERLLNLLTR